MRMERDDAAPGARFVFAGVGILVWAVLVCCIPARVGLGLPTGNAVLHNGESERLYEEPSVFAGFSGLSWGTEVCPQQETAEHWQRTWHRVQLPNGTVGWVLQDDLVAQAAFGDSLRARHAAKLAELTALLVEVRELEERMKVLGHAMPMPDLHTVILAWVQASPGKMAVPESEPIAEPEPTPTATPQPTPTPAPVVPATPWYEGGTLHQGTLADWAQATHANRLATMADMVVAILNADDLQLGKDYTEEQLLVLATEMVVGVDEVAIDRTWAF